MASAGLFRAGKAAVRQVWQAADAQERADEDAEGARATCLGCGQGADPAFSQDRKYFDSGDYALSKAGVAPQSTVGTAIPNPEK